MAGMRATPQRSTRSRVTLIGAVLAIGVLLAAACGSDSTDSDGSASSSDTTSGQSSGTGSGEDGEDDNGDREPPPLVDVEPDEGGNDTDGGDDDQAATDGNGGDSGSDGGLTDDFVAPPTTNDQGNTEGDGPTPQEIIEELIDDPTTEVGGEVPETPEVVETLSIDAPCDLFTTDELGDLVAGWSDQTGLTGDLPPGLLEEGSTIEFSVETDTETSCDWFSDQQVWLVSTVWEASEPSFTAIVLSAGTPIDDVGEEAALLSDTRAAAVVEGLLVTVTNLAPGGADSNSDAAVTQLLLAEVVERIADAA
ncbi:MAG: hypothetical protein ACR2QE_16775 [Acidimicrobiales bacterium]